MLVNDVELDRIDFDLPAPDSVSAADFDFRPAPQPESDRDVTAQYVCAQLPTELHLLRLSKPGIEPPQHLASPMIVRNNRLTVAVGRDQ